MKLFKAALAIVILISSKHAQPIWGLDFGVGYSHIELSHEAKTKEEIWDLLLVIDANKVPVLLAAMDKNKNILSKQKSLEPDLTAKIDSLIKEIENTEKTISSLKLQQPKTTKNGLGKYYPPQGNLMEHLDKIHQKYGEILVAHYEKIGDPWGLDFKVDLQDMSKPFTGKKFRCEYVIIDEARLNSLSVLLLKNKNILKLKLSPDDSDFYNLISNIEAMEKVIEKIFRRREHDCPEGVVINSFAFFEIKYLASYLLSLRKAYAILLANNEIKYQPESTLEGRSS